MPSHLNPRGVHPYSSLTYIYQYCSPHVLDNASVDVNGRRDDSVDFGELNLEDVIAGGLLDFDGWISLISHVEKAYPENIEKISLVYDSFLSEFPLCYGYWRKYANHKAHLSTTEKAIKVFEQAVESATYSVGIWVDYCAFGVLAYDDPQDVRRLFNRGLSFIGKDYLCHILWDRYVEFEYSHQNWSSLAYIYLQTLKCPTKKLQHYYDRFKKFTAIWEEELECHTMSGTEEHPETLIDCVLATCCKDDEILSIIKDLLDSSEGLTRSTALKKYVFSGEQLYLGACHLEEKIHGFEMHIRRPYFHVKPLDAFQLENWHHYLDFVEMHGDFDWAVKVYERCLIACANYPEFWMRYVEFVDTKGGREIANFALDRATKVFLKRLPAIHHFNARYKEQIGDIVSARGALLKCDADSDSTFVDKVMKQANMEKRLGNFLAAAKIYNDAIKSTKKKKRKRLHALPIIYIKFSRLKYMITDSAYASRDILIDGIKQVPHSKLLLEELINFTMLHGSSAHINVVDSIIYDALARRPNDSRGLSSKDQEDISTLYLELIDFCGTVHDARKAWIRHRKLFPYSLRSTTASTEPSRKVMGKRQDIPASMPQYLRGSNNSEQRSQQLIVTNEELPSIENHHIQDVQNSTDWLQPREANPNMSETLQQECHIILKSSAEDAHGPCTLVGEKVANDTESIIACRDHCVTNTEDHDCETQMDLKQVSLENLSLNTENNGSPDLIPKTVHGYEAPKETHLSTESSIKRCHAIDGNPSISEQPETQRTDSTQMIYTGVLKDGEVTNKNSSISEQPETQRTDSTQMIYTGVLKDGEVTNKNSSISCPQVMPDGNYKLSNSFPAPANHDNPQVKINNMGHPNVESSIAALSPDKLQQQQYQQAEMGYQGNIGQSMHQKSVQTLEGVQTQYQPGAVISQGNPTTMHAGASPSQSQQPAQPVPYSSEHMAQYPMQSFDQSGNAQNSQAYYQMWQYYYYQQQQLFQQQQYYQHQQTTYSQEQLQQQYQQQQQYLQQQPPYQHTQFGPQQQQVQQQSYQQQQLQPLQQQQQMPYQAQQIPQQLPNPQIPQLPDPQLLQQLLQQQQWKKQQMEIHTKQQEQEHSQDHQQFQALTPPEGSPAGNTLSLSPHLHEPSPQT